MIRPRTLPITRLNNSRQDVFYSDVELTGLYDGFRDRRTYTAREADGEKTFPVAGPIALIETEEGELLVKKAKSAAAPGEMESLTIPADRLKEFAAKDCGGIRVSLKETGGMGK